MRTGYARVTEAMCAHCTAPFEARLSEIARGAGRFCSAACKYAASRGRAMTTLACEQCDTVFRRFTYLTRRPLHHYCSVKCAADAVDPAARAEAGRRGGSAPHKPVAPEVAAARSRLGGLARAARLPRERLQEIARKGVSARLAKPFPVRQAIARRATVTRLGVKRWFGVNVLPDSKRRTGTDG